MQRHTGNRTIRDGEQSEGKHMKDMQEGAPLQEESDESDEYDRRVKHEQEQTAQDVTEGKK